MGVEIQVDRGQNDSSDQSSLRSSIKNGFVPKHSSLRWFKWRASILYRYGSMQFLNCAAIVFFFFPSLVPVHSTVYVKGFNCFMEFFTATLSSFRAKQTWDLVQFILIREIKACDRSPEKGLNHEYFHSPFLLLFSQMSPFWFSFYVSVCLLPWHLDQIYFFSNSFVCIFIPLLPPLHCRRSRLGWIHFSPQSLTNIWK